MCNIMAYKFFMDSMSLELASKQKGREWERSSRMMVGGREVKPQKVKMAEP